MNYIDVKQGSIRSSRYCFAFKNRLEVVGKKLRNEETGARAKIRND